MYSIHSQTPLRHTQMITSYFGDEIVKRAWADVVGTYYHAFSRDKPEWTHHDTYQVEGYWSWAYPLRVLLRRLPREWDRWMNRRQDTYELLW